MAEKSPSEDPAVQAPRVTPYAGAVLLTVFGFLCLAFPGVVQKVTLYDQFTGSAQSLVDEAYDRNLAVFLGLSAIKAVMALLEGSTVGIGFALEVGDLVQPAFDYVDFIWRAFLYSFVVLGFYDLLLRAGMLELGFVATGIGAFLWASGALPYGRAASLSHWGKLLVMIGFLISHVVPVSLVATHYISDSYIEPLKEANEDRIKDVKEQVGLARDDIFALRGKISLFSPGESVQEIKDSSVAIAQRVSDSVWGSIRAFINSIVILFVQLCLLPFATAYVLYKVLASGLRRLEQNFVKPGGAKVSNATS